jgi:adenylate cyclase
MLDANRLYFLVGDVSGKGLPASIFMAVSKALCKSTALRHGELVEDILRDAGTEIGRENPEALFVTAFAGVLDAGSGLLRYCSAGHDAPFLLSRGQKGVSQLDSAGGPPLCVIDGYRYIASERQLQPGDTLCLITDGVTEAMNAAGEMYGQKRLRAVLERLRDAPSVGYVGEAVRGDVAAFVGAAEPADDLTLLVLRWTAPGASAR